MAPLACGPPCFAKRVHWSISLSHAFPDATAARLSQTWWISVKSCLAELASRNTFASLEGVAVNGTSGTVLAIDSGEMPVGRTLMYNDPCPDRTIVERIDTEAPPDSPARGATSALARAIHLSRQTDVHAIVHQADWILTTLGLDIATSDENNALKTGYDLAAERWPGWLEDR